MNQKLWKVTVLVLAGMLAVPAMGYTVVDTSAPAINCVFSPTCSVVVNDMVSTMANGGRIQSRVFQGQQGSPAAGKWVYEYRIDMRNAVGVLSIPYVTKMSIVNWGPVLSYDYDSDAVATDQVFVITAGGLGSVGLSSASYFWWTGATTFSLSGAVYGGSFPGDGQSSYFFGLVSDSVPTVKPATIQTDAGAVPVNVYAPLIP